MPAGAVLEHDFLPRAAAILASEPDLAWVTAFGASGDMPAHAPPGSYRLPLAEMDASPSVALVRRTALESATRDEDAVRDGHSNIFVQLARAGAHGVVLQEPLVREPSAPGDAARARSALIRAPLDQAAAKAKQGGEPGMSNSRSRSLSTAR